MMDFKLGPLFDAENRIKQEFTDFSRLWANVRENWEDERRQRFQREHLDSIAPSLNRFLTELQDFADSIRKADRALEDGNRDGQRLE